MRMIGARSARVPGGMASIVSAALFGPVLLGVAPARAHPHVWVTTETTVLYENGTIVGLRHKWSFDDFYTAMALQGLDKNNDGVYDRSELAELAKVNVDGLKDFDYFTVVSLGGETLKFQAPKEAYLEHADAPASQSQVVGATDPKVAKETAEADPRDARAAGAPPSPEPGFFSRWWRWAFGAPADKGKASEGNAPGADKGKAAMPPAPTKVLSLHFTLPLAQPVLADASGFSFAISDPSFFIALEPAAEDAVVLGPGAPADCRVVAGAPEAPPAPARATPPAAGEPPATTTEPNPAADLNRLGDAFAQQFGGPSVATRFGRATSISCGPRS
jgi:ABC-type uncharacterized transport system substrate-binding protein